MKELEIQDYITLKQRGWPRVWDFSVSDFEPRRMQRHCEKSL